MDAELQAVKSELSKLKGCPILTVDRHSANYIKDTVGHIWVQTSRNPHRRVPWDQVFDKYAQTKTPQGFTANPKRDNGAFITGLLANLTVCELDTSAPKRTLRYLPRGPVKLRANSPYRRCP